VKTVTTTPGSKSKTLVRYRGVECPELGIENTKYRDPKKILEYFHSKMEEESFDGKDEATPNLGKFGFSRFYSVV
jgi:hypothetical protein